MSTDFETMTAEAPTLDFGAFDATIKEAPAEIIPKPESAEDDTMLSEDQKQMVAQFVEKIDLRNTNAILQYGAGTQKKMADFSDKALENVRTKDMGEIGEMVSSLVVELKSFDVQEEEKGLGSFFKKKANKITALKAKYDKADANVEKIAQALETHQIQLIKDAQMLDKMYEMNLNYFKELSMYIIAGKKKVAQAKEQELAQLRAKAQASGLPEDAQEAKDYEDLIERFEKKLHDLELTRAVALQTAPQIRLVQSSDTVMAEKIQSTIVNTIPLWKSQMVIALGVAHASAAAQAQHEVTDMTNELLKKNANTLKIATVESAKESERGVVDIETLKETNATLISTLDEVMKIQTEGRAKRAAAEAELRTIENELKAKLLEVR
ncbi:MAG: toxic anion resistance protein [bacterium]|nr:toxic anion resistance protein [bacterium]